jgi:hypothetical protein
LFNIVFSTERVDSSGSAACRGQGTLVTESPTLFAEV